MEMYIFLLEAEDFICNKPVNLLYLLYQNDNMICTVIR